MPIAGKIVLDNVVELGRRTHVGHASTKLTCTWATLGICAGVLAHEHRGLRLAKSLPDQFVVSLQALPLL